jgi:hypothetical protein
MLCGRGGTGPHKANDPIAARIPVKTTMRLSTEGGIREHSKAKREYVIQLKVKMMTAS